MGYSWQQGGRHEGFSVHYRARCEAFQKSSKREFGEFLKLAGTGYIRVDFYGQEDVFLHWREARQAANDIEAIHDSLFLGCDVECVQLGENWYIERQKVFESATNKQQSRHRSPGDQKSKWRIAHGFSRHIQGSTV